MSERKQKALQRAVEAGTLGKIDRSKQYDENDPELRTAAALLRSQNHQWSEIRRLQLWVRVVSGIVSVLGLVLAIVKALNL